MEDSAERGLGQVSNDLSAPPRLFSIPGLESPFLVGPKSLQEMIRHLLCTPIGRLTGIKMWLASLSLHERVCRDFFLPAVFDYCCRFIAIAWSHSGSGSR
jgi:hypothetical protein